MRFISYLLIYFITQHAFAAMINDRVPLGKIAPEPPVHITVPHKWTCIHYSRVAPNQCVLINDLIGIDENQTQLSKGKSYPALDTVDEYFNVAHRFEPQESLCLHRFYQWQSDPLDAIFVVTESPPAKTRFPLAHGLWALWAIVLMWGIRETRVHRRTSNK